MNLKPILDGLAAELVNRHGYRPSGLSVGMRRKLALEEGDSVRCLEIFGEWLERCPEAKQFLEDAGPNAKSFAGSLPCMPVAQPAHVMANGSLADTPEQAIMVPQDVGPQAGPGPKQFRARIGEHWKLVELQDVRPGGQLFVREVGVASYGPHKVVTMGCVAADETAKVAAWVSQMEPKGLRWEDGTPATGENAPVTE